MSLGANRESKMKAGRWKSRRPAFFVSSSGKGRPKMSHYILIGYFPEAVETDTEPMRLGFLGDAFRRKF